MNNKIFCFAINSDLSLLPFDEPRKSFSAINWIIKTDTGKEYRTIITDRTNAFPIYSYQILNSELIETNIQVGNWRIIDIYEKEKKHSFSATFFRIVDGIGIVKELQFYHNGLPILQIKQHENTGSCFEENAIVTAIKFLNEIKEFHSWASLEQFYENKKLKAEIEDYKKIK